MSKVTHAATISVRPGRAQRLEVLLIRTSGGERWVFPKGRIDKGETPAQAALRETREEAGWLGVVDPEPVDEFKYYKRKDKKGVRVIAFLMRADGRVEPDEQREQLWAELDDAQEMLADGRPDKQAAELHRALGAAVERFRLSQP